MDTYAANSYMYGIHEYRITLMSDEYVGHITSRVGGNTKGKSILSHALDFFDVDVGKFTSDCQFEFDESGYLCNFTLHDKDGNELEFEEFDLADVSDMVVAVEIVGFEPKNI